MKVKKLIKEHYKAIIERNKEKQQEIYQKITKKSLKHKKTFAVK